LQLSSQLSEDPWWLSLSSFSTTFVIAIGFQHYKGHGLAFMLSSTNDLSNSLPGEFLGLPVSTSDDHVFFAVELDTVLNPELKDIRPVRFAGLLC
jgi:hypothetical protein